MAESVVKLPHYGLRSRLRRRSIGLLQRVGLSLVLNNFHSPIPDLRTLNDSTWQRQTEMVGIDLREAAQLSFLRELVALYSPEFGQLPREQSTEARNGQAHFYVKNDWFESVDCEMAYSIVRRFKPRRIVEVGSGFSTLVMLRALETNRLDGHDGELLAVDPNPWLPRDGHAELLRLQVTEVQNMPLSAFTELCANDILFIDSSHVLKMGSDVQYEYLEVLARLQPGVLVHIHDIYLPATYPRAVIMHDHHFWNEQDVLQAFLIGNSYYEVLLAAHYLHLRHRDLLAELIPSYHVVDPNFGPSSFWMRRV